VRAELAGLRNNAIIMLSIFTPHLQLDSVLHLTPERLCGFGRQGLLLDVDCTLKDHGATEFGRPIISWVSEMRAAGIQMCLLSNGRAERIGALARTLDVPFVAKSFKPFPFGCHAALRILGLRPEQAAVVGDQIFADILAGRLSGIFTVLVRPTSPVEPWFTRLKRPLERVVLRRLARNASATASAQSH
jgi:uncharacterized protein